VGNGAVGHAVGGVVSASGAEAAELIDAYWDTVERRFTAQLQVMASLRQASENAT